jgi:hypothetical protein
VGHAGKLALQPDGFGQVFADVELELDHDPTLVVG